MNGLTMVLLFAAGIAVGVTIAWLLLGKRKFNEEQTKQSFESLSYQVLLNNSEQFLRLAKEKMAAQTEIGTQELETKKKLIDQRLEAMNATLGEVKGLIGKLNEDDAALGEQVRATATEARSLREVTSRLQTALAGTKSRGAWGERIAEDILHLLGLQEGVHYRRQQSASSENGKVRPDFTFLLPGDKILNMDVKFPLDNYLRYLQADAETDRETYRAQFWKDVKTRIGEVAKQGYIVPPLTLDYALAFIPNEAVFTFIMENESRGQESLFDFALRSRVLLCSPLSLYAILSVVRQAVLNFQLDQATGRMQRLFADFRREWGSFGKCFESLEESLEKAQQILTTLRTTRTNKLDRVLGKIEALSLPESEETTTTPSSRTEGDSCRPDL